MRATVVALGLVLAACAGGAGDGAATRAPASGAPARPAADGNAGGGAAHTDAPSDETLEVLVFSATAGYRHASIPAGVDAVRQLGADRGWRVDATEDATRFTDAGLARYDVVVWLSTSGDVLDAGQQTAFARWVRAGGGYAGVHAAADTEHGWPWYGGLVGARFDRHPQVQEARVLIEDRTHPSTAHLEPEWMRTDEWYDFRRNPRTDVTVLLTIDEDSYDGGAMGTDHPVAWYHTHDGGRAWYTAGGHTTAAFAEPDFRVHLAGGIAWAAGVGAG